MKKEKCKLLLWIGIILISLSFIFLVIMTFAMTSSYEHEAVAKVMNNPLFVILFILLLILFSLFSTPLGWAGSILIIIAIVKWNSEKSLIKNKKVSSKNKDKS